MNNENEKIIGLLSKINAAQNEMIAAISPLGTYSGGYCRPFTAF